MANQFKQRAVAYRRKAHEAKSADDRRHYAAIAARCRKLAEDADVIIGAAVLADETSSPLEIGNSPQTRAAKVPQGAKAQTA